ncbi:thioredoxin family protein [Streptomyces sp. NPDC097619]|uniref:thioredoxin family protein n=1 Tax=Streptomyces sp. NPDC097619 TaxID=3157228 RepID=UPI0033175760
MHTVDTKSELDGFLAEHRDRLVVVFFGEPGARKCQRIGPRLMRVAEAPEFSDVAFVRVNVVLSEELAAACGVSAAPTFPQGRGHDRPVHGGGRGPAEGPAAHPRLSRARPARPRGARAPRRLPTAARPP